MGLDKLTRGEWRAADIAIPSGEMLWAVWADVAPAQTAAATTRRGLVAVLGATNATSPAECEANVRVVAAAKEMAGLLLEMLESMKGGQPLLANWAVAKRVEAVLRKAGVVP